MPPSSCTQEKDSTLSDDYGKDLASVQALQRKHEGYEVGVVSTCIFVIIDLCHGTVYMYMYMAALCSVYIFLYMYMHYNCTCR